MYSTGVEAEQVSEVLFSLLKYKSRKFFIKQTVE